MVAVSVGLDVGFEIIMWPCLGLEKFVCPCPWPGETRNSSGDEIANVNVLYDDIVRALKIQ